MINPEFKEILEKLRSPVPERLIKNRVQGGSKIDYIEWTTALDLLDATVGNYSIDIRRVEILGDYLFMEVGIKIGDETRYNVGSEKLSHKGFGDPFTNAYAQALKRSAASWGVARALYQDDDGQQVIKEHEVASKALVGELITTAARKGYSDEKLSASLTKNFSEVNPFKLTIDQVQAALAKLRKLPDIVKEE